MNIAQHLERACIFFPHKKALIFEGRAYTYRQLDEISNRIANWLYAIGFKRGDRVALFLPNIPAFVFAYFAIQKIGAIAVSINPMLKKDEVAHIVNDAGVKVIFTTAFQREHILDRELPTLDTVVIAEGESGDDVSLEEIITRGNSSFRAVDLEREDPAVILYTSGTTGSPKGATLSQSNIIFNTYAAVHHKGIRPSDRLHLFLPLSHVFAQNDILNPGINACATVVLERRFEPEPALYTIQREKVTMFFAVPTIYIYLLNMDTSPFNLSTVRYCFSAAAHLPPKICEHWEARYNLKIFCAYGLTESSPFASYNHDLRIKIGSIGTPIENVEMKIVDEDNKELRPGELGEIVIKGPNVMKGYWNNPEATAQVIRNGWLRSGDIGMTDDEGYFYIVDRLKDMINTAGFKVYPSEVEQVLHQHPTVQEASVFGIPDPVKGEVVKAAVVLKKGSTAAAEEILEFCRSRIASYKVPRVVEFMNEFPKTASGKILKRVLRNRERTKEREN